MIPDFGHRDPDARGYFGDFGGRFVPETLVAPVAELERAYLAARADESFKARLAELLRDYVGRPTPLYEARRLSAALGGARVFLKREDLAHTGAHKINNAIGQALLASRMGKRRVIAETGAGQHGVATATACALLGLPCVVYMGARDVERQRPNVLRMEALGAEVRPVHSGSATLKDGINEAMRDWVTNVATTHYVLGSAMGPHPYPTIVRDLQRVIGDEAAAQLRALEGRLPDVVIACVGARLDPQDLPGRPIELLEQLRPLVARQLDDVGVDRLDQARQLVRRGVGRDEHHLDRAGQGARVAGQLCGASGVERAGSAGDHVEPDVVGARPDGGEQVVGMGDAADLDLRPAVLCGQVVRHGAGGGEGGNRGSRVGGAHQCLADQRAVEAQRAQAHDRRRVANGRLGHGQPIIGQ